MTSVIGIFSVSKSSQGPVCVSTVNTQVLYTVLIASHCSTDLSANDENHMFVVEHSVTFNCNRLLQL